MIKILQMFARHMRQSVNLGSAAGGVSPLIVNYQILKHIFVGCIMFEKYTLLKSVALVTAHHSHSLLTK